MVLRQDLVATDETAETEPQQALVHVDKDVQEALIEARPRSKWVVAVMGGTERKGQWRVPKHLRVVTVMGGTELDFREAVLTPGVHNIKIVACMGGVEITVPPNLAVECEGMSIMGGFESMERCPAVPDPERPLLRISGAAIMGGIEISTRLPGESARQARKRLKRERKAKLEASKQKQLEP